MIRNKIGPALLGLMIVSTACSDRNKTSDSETSEAETIDVALPQVRDVTLSKSYPGYLTAAARVDIVARVGGRLTSAPYTAGPVKKGDILFTIDDTPYRNAVEKAAAALQSAKFQLAYAQSHYDALKKAYEADAVSGMEVDQALSAVQQYEASVQTAQAALSDANTQLGYCTIRAPFDGRVASRNVDPGAIVSPDGQLTTIFDEEHFNVNFEIDDDQYLTMLNEGNGEIGTLSMPVSFSEPLPHEYSATLSYISPDVQTSTGTFSLQGRLENPYQELRAGMYVTINLPYADVDSAIVVPASAISTDQRGDYLYTVGADNTIEYTPVTASYSLGDSLKVITRGLKPGQPYVTKALLKVRPGQKINPRYE